MASAQVAVSARQAARAALRRARPYPTAPLAKPVKKHEKLAKTLEWLSKEPKPVLEKIASLELTYAYRNDHFGARYVRIPRRQSWGQPRLPRCGCAAFLKTSGARSLLTV